MNSMVPDLLLRCHTAVLDTGALLPELENVSTAAKKATGLGNVRMETEGTVAIPAESPDTSPANAGKGQSLVVPVAQRAEANLLAGDATAEANHAVPPAAGPLGNPAPASRPRRPRLRKKATGRLPPRRRMPAARTEQRSVAGALPPSKKAGTVPPPNANVRTTTSDGLIAFCLPIGCFSPWIPSCLRSVVLCVSFLSASLAQSARRFYLNSTSFFCFIQHLGVCLLRIMQSAADDLVVRLDHNLVGTSEFALDSMNFP
mmetsp:Transcript_26503/g.45652  ORF Transcript_26503/g.45652 Transcript_26503/m.45652 type:complete len:259 (+) Transcript_26503:359-1135(+)